MPDFNAKMHQNRFRLGLRPRPRWAAGGAYSAPPDPLAAIGFKGPTSKGREKKGRIKLVPCGTDGRLLLNA